jgi:outer membrane receptor protein involved in Fe transport
VNYSLPLPSDFGVDLSFQGNILLKFEVENEGDIEDRLGTVANLSAYDGAFSKLRFMTDLTLSWKIISLSNQVRFLGPVEYFRWDKQTPEDPWDDIPIHDCAAAAYWNMALWVSWKDLDFGVGLDNVLDKDPPLIPGGDGNSNPNSYDFIGRYIYANLGYQF